MTCFECQAEVGWGRRQEGSCVESRNEQTEGDDRSTEAEIVATEMQNEKKQICVSAGIIELSH